MTVFDSWILRLSRALNDDRNKLTDAIKTLATEDGNAWKASQLQDILNDAITEYINGVCEQTAGELQQLGIVSTGLGFAIAAKLPELNKQDSLNIIMNDDYTGHADLPSDFGHWVDGKLNTSDNVVSYEVFKVGAPQWWGVRSHGNTEQSSFYLTLMSNQVHIYRQTAWKNLTPAINKITFNYIRMEPEFTVGGQSDTSLRRRHSHRVIQYAVRIATEYKKRTT